MAYGGYRYVKFQFLIGRVKMGRIYNGSEYLAMFQFLIGRVKITRISQP